MIRQSTNASRPYRLANRKASPFSKQAFAHAFRVMAPTLIALTFASAAHGHRVCLRDGFPRRFSNASDPELSNTRGRRVADRPQSPEDVPTLGLEPQPEELL